MQIRKHFKDLDNIVYFAVSISSVLYCVFCFTKSCRKYFENFQDDYNDFTDGFPLFSTKRDKTDMEWESISYLFYNYFPWIIVYNFLVELIRYQNLSYKVHQLCQITFMVIYFYLQGNMGFLVILFLQPSFFYFVRFPKRTFVCTWLCSCISLIFITLYKRHIVFSDSPTSNKHQIHLFTVCMYWLNLKCTSFFLENSNSIEFLNLISYCFYPPTFFTGPFIFYEDFKNIYIVCNKSQARIRKLIKSVMWCISWYVFGHICLHFVYVNATSFQPQFVETLDYVSLCGYGYAMGQFFHIKYLVQYGLSTTLASFENANVPNLPRCIGRIHLYSDMWRYFDPGLYTFLKRYIYIPMLNTLEYKLVATFFCFCFVCVWHGLDDNIIIWSVMNYIGVVIEYISTTAYKKHAINISETLGHSITNILENLVASPLLAFSAISNFYFFGGRDIGEIFLRRLFGNVFDSIWLLLVLYCCCQVSTNLRKIEARKM